METTEHKILMNFERIALLHTFLFVSVDRYVRFHNPDGTEVIVTSNQGNLVGYDISDPESRRLGDARPFHPTMVQWQKYLEQLRQTPSPHPNTYPTLWDEIENVASVYMDWNLETEDIQRVPRSELYDNEQPKPAQKEPVKVAHLTVRGKTITLTRI